MKLQRKKLECPPPFVSMADIAFNLVLFFVIMAKTQDDSDTWQPAKGKNTQQVPASQVTIMVSTAKANEESKIYLNGKQVGIRDIADAVGNILGKNPPENRAVLLKVDKDAQAGIFEPIMEAVSLSGGDVFHVLDDDQTAK